MAQPAHDRTVTLTSTTHVATTFSVLLDADTWAREQVSFMKDGNGLVEHNLPGKKSGDLPFKYIPDTAGSTAAVQMSTAVDNGELFTMTVTQVAVGAEAAAPSAANPVVTYTGYIFRYPSGTVAPGATIEYDLTLSIVSRAVAVA